MLYAASLAIRDFTLGILEQPSSPYRCQSFSDLQGVAVDRQGDLYMTESGDCRVRKLSMAGDTLGLLGSCGAAQGQFHDPQAIAVAADGNVYVADRLNDRIVKLSPSLGVVKTFGTHGSTAMDSSTSQTELRSTRRAASLSPTATTTAS